MLSVLLPTIRPHLILGALASITASAGATPIDLVVVADFDPPIATQATWIRSERRGVVAAANLAYEAAIGDAVFLTNDETTYLDDAVAVLSRTVEAHPDRLFSPRHTPWFPFVYYGMNFAPFPCASKALIDRLGGLLDQVYRGFYADPDLSLRAHAAAVGVDVVQTATILHQNRHDAVHHEAVTAYHAADRETFARRWAHLGPLVDP